jgi:hypothetical protein
MDGRRQEVSQQGISTSGIDRHGDPTVSQPDILAPVTASDDGCYRQPSSLQDALDYNHQQPAAGAGELQ